MSVDPLAAKYPGWSPYNYCRNNPLRLLDPKGMDDEDVNKWWKDILKRAGRSSDGYYYGSVPEERINHSYADYTSANGNDEFTETNTVVTANGTIITIRATAIVHPDGSVTYATYEVQKLNGEIIGKYLNIGQRVFSTYMDKIIQCAIDKRINEGKSWTKSLVKEYNPLRRTQLRADLLINFVSFFVGKGAPQWAQSISKAGNMKSGISILDIISEYNNLQDPNSDLIHLWIK